MQYLSCCVLICVICSSVPPVQTWLTHHVFYCHFNACELIAGPILFGTSVALVLILLLSQLVFSYLILWQMEAEDEEVFSFTLQILLSCPSVLRCPETDVNNATVGTICSGGWTQIWWSTEAVKNSNDTKLDSEIWTATGVYSKEYQAVDSHQSEISSVYYS